ncbi:MAG: type I-C CRISPR-associated protein Cas7/Csd2 [Candidatus Omnitrophica bacterium]|mgnify:CR=1 FL=1|nr:type I-C CRISPR-associated protein Cas7/Csd2 [Candidatus Omnitrophota bacterium]
MTTPLTKRYDFVLFFDVQDGNPNGDPDAGNLPRIDAETGMGLVTDVCIKRKVRNYVQIVKGGNDGFDIFVKEKAVLNQLIETAHEQDGVKTKEKNEKTEAARQWMCSQYYDIRTFGAVMTTGANAGQVRGPIQLTFARSVEPVVALEHSITRVAKTTEERAETGGSEMGRKYTVPYGLYRAHGFVSPHLADQTGFGIEDLDLFWKALQQMFDYDHSAARGLMTTRALIIFGHGTALGSASAASLFDRVEAKRMTEGPARKFSDYQILLDNQPVVELPKIVRVG